MKNAYFSFLIHLFNIRFCLFFIFIIVCAINLLELRRKLKKTSSQDSSQHIHESSFFSHNRHDFPSNKPDSASSSLIDNSVDCEGAIGSECCPLSLMRCKDECFYIFNSRVSFYSSRLDKLRGVHSENCCQCQSHESMRLDNNATMEVEKKLLKCLSFRRVILAVTDLCPLCEAQVMKQ